LAGSAESGLAFAERLVQLIRFGARRAGLVSGEQAEDLLDQGGIRRAMPSVAPEQLGGGIEHERENRAVRLSNSQGMLQGKPTREQPFAGHL